MISLAIIRKSAREQRWFIALSAGGCMLFPIIFLHAFEAFDLAGAAAFLELPFVKTVVRALTGADISEVMNRGALAAFPFVHPAMLALGWVYVIAAATRAFAGEIENGTADLLLALPITRWRIYASVSAWLLIACTLIALAAWIGAVVGLQTTTLSRELNGWGLRYIVLNHALMLSAVAGMAGMISAFSTRRGRAMALAFAILLFSFLLNWLAAFWEPAQRLAFAGILQYHRPYIIIREGGPIWGDLAVLGAIAAATWVGGGIAFARRDIPAP